MNPAERLAIVALMDHLRPRLSMEIGSKYGGSLAVLSHYSERVISLDIDPTVPERLKHFPNVDFMIGDSGKTLPAKLTEIEEAREPLGFALIDGDHSAEGVRRDIESFLHYCPLGSLYILMHDSFNPDVRRGIKSAGWQDCAYVQALDLDFVPGIMMSERPLAREMWGGFALAVLGPDRRKGKLKPRATAELVYRAAYPVSMHNLLFRRATQAVQAIRRLDLGR
ncbi:MAG: class I SAM-dependent methyltransferase [Chloroflexia bacterium]